MMHGYKIKMIAISVLTLWAEGCSTCVCVCVSLQRVGKAALLHDRVVLEGSTACKF